MEKRNHFNRKVYLFFILLLPTLTLLILLSPYKQALVFEYTKTNRVLAYIPFPKESTFQIKYTHSIHLSDVIESYKVKPNQQIQLYELVYNDFAIGMPANAEEGETFEQKNGKYYIRNMNRTFPSFDLRIGQVKANHRVIYQDNTYPLSRFIDPGTLVRIKIKNINLLQQLKGVNILES